MPESASRNHPTTSVPGGGTSATPTPANNVGGGNDSEEHREGLGHVAAPNPRGTMGRALGLQEQKSHAKSNFLQQDDAVNVRPTSEHGEPTCATEDHSFMNRKPGASDALPGWETFRNVLGPKGTPS
ncbi:hypothetical protein N7486_006634 [Penicillium sp. IBT 16267x]|nr:hypothetical protein N7486_006634 [Penicillium sp. IBT 16267x]